MVTHAITTDSDRVPQAWACQCGEDRMDALILGDDDTVRCETCGATYTLQATTATEPLTIAIADRADPVIGTVRWLYRDDSAGVRFGKFTSDELDVDTIAVVMYDDGSMFTPSDWQTTQPDTEHDVADWEWIDPATFRPAVMIGGWPRQFPS